MLRELYETQFGIHNHLQKRDASPFASVAFHQSEDVVTGSRYQETVRNHLNLKIFDLTGLDYDSYIDRPPDRVAILNEEIKKYLDEKAKKADELARQLKEGIKAPSDKTPL